MSAPAIPAGYRRLKVGEKRPKGYALLSSFRGRILTPINNSRVGDRITASEDRMFGPYIAPVRKARKEGGKKG